jgi:hypothetical protein
MRQIKINDVIGVPIISRTDAKNYIRIDTTADDLLIDLMIEAAHTAAENYMSRDIIAKERTYYLDFSTSGFIDVPFGPVASVDAVTVKDVAVSFSVFGLGDPMVEIEPAAVNIKIDFTTEGMSDGLLKQALLMMVSTYYDNRTDFVTGMTVNEVPSASAKLLDGIKAVFI